MRTRLIVRALSSGGSRHGKTVISALGASDATSIDIASLASNAEITVFPWREPPDLKARTINRVRTFLKSHVPMLSAAQ